MAEFHWTKARIEAARLVAEDELSNEAIAAAVGVSRPTIDAWKRHPAFRARVVAHEAALDAAVSRYAIAKRRKRIQQLDELAQRLWTVIAERAAHYTDLATDNQDAVLRLAGKMFGSVEETIVPPGGTTGLVVRQLKMVGTGPGARLVEEYAVDVQTVKELRALHEQAAKELGQWVSRAQVDHTITIEEAAQQVATEFGLDPAAVLAEAEHILAALGDGL